MVLFFSVFVFSILGLFICEKTASKTGFLDYPGYRKTHLEVTPRNAGLVLFFAVLFGIIYFKVENLKNLILPMFIIFIGGFIDDLRKETPAFVKLAFQIVGSILFLIPLSIPIELKFFLFLFQVGIINSFNLLDNMNGVTAFLSMALMAGLAFFSKSIDTAFLTCFFASISAFLLRNYPYGKIFLGDQGSQFLGFLLSSVFIILFLNGEIISLDPWKRILFPLVMILGVFNVFIVDTFWVIYWRLKNRKSIFQGDQNHLTHLLNRSGVPANYIPFILVGIQLPILSLSMYFWQHSLGRWQ